MMFENKKMIELEFEETEVSLEHLIDVLKK